MLATIQDINPDKFNYAANHRESDQFQINAGAWAKKRASSREPALPRIPFPPGQKAEILRFLLQIPGFVSNSYKIQDRDWELFRTASLQLSLRSLWKETSWTIK